MANVERTLMTLNQIIRQSRKSLGQIARETGLSISHVSRLHSGERKPSIETIGKLAVALDLSPGDLYTIVASEQRANGNRKRVSTYTSAPIPTADIDPQERYKAA